MKHLPLISLVFKDEGDGTGRGKATGVFCKNETWSLGKWKLVGTTTKR